MRTFAAVRDEIDGHGLTLVRAHPRSDRLHLDLTDPDGHRVIGQWIGDRAVASGVAAATDEVAPGSTRLLGDHLVLQSGGADRRLQALAPLVAAGAELVVHRPERRAVVRSTGPVVYTKVVRPRRTADLVRRMQAAAEVPGLTAPGVTAWDERAGTIMLTTLPGMTLHDLLTSGVSPAVAKGVGVAVRALHDAGDRAPEWVTGHDLAAEVDATHGLLEQARAHRALGAREVSALERDIASAVAQIAAVDHSGRPALLHRDLHDKQLLVDADAIGMLDVDTLGIGDPALDVGNLLAHLDLRVRQGWTTTETAKGVEDGVLAGYGPDERTLAAAAGYRALTTARLRALYAFRPGDSPPSA